MRTPPSAFDLVTCWFPERSDLDTPGPRLRPCLVSAVYQGESGGFACRVHFGTKNLKIMQRLHRDVIVQNHWDMEAFGLTVATRFDLDFVAILPWTTDFFDAWHGSASPVIGTLTENYIKDFAFKMMQRNVGKNAKPLGNR